MLPKLFYEIDKNTEMKISKFIYGKDVSALGAFECGSMLEIEVSVSRNMGVTSPVVRICRDGERDRDIPFIYKSTDFRNDVYSLILDTKEMCGESGCGLFYYYIVLVRGSDTLYTDTYNNIDFTLCEKENNRFRLLIYKQGFKTPESFGHGVMYQIFTDRFYKGESVQAQSVPVRYDAIINEDWENGIPQYAEPGMPLANNMFFGGTLWGIAEKLDYLKELGVSVIYLCPIFEAYSNHKYDTGNYLKIDEMFGGEEAFKNLIEKAREVGISIVLDGVFNHTGDDSVYFNRKGRYGTGGAYNDKNSPYYNWYHFASYPDKYESWWGIEILPRLDHSCEGCRKFFTGEGGVVQKYIDMGIGGWRLDVADELSDEFLDELRATAKKASNGEAVIIGEVWENAADKSAYGHRRRYLRGDQLDSVMNYPLRNAIIDFCLWGNSDMLYNVLVEIYASYPKCVSDKLMNIIGTHDTERILTVLGRDEGDELRSMRELSHAKLSSKQREKGVKLLKIAAALQYMSYGIPSLYYGDEVGVEGYRDPFCRMPFPWDEMDKKHRAELHSFYQKLGSIRQNERALDGGDFFVTEKDDSYISFARKKGDSKVVLVANRGEPVNIKIPDGEIYLDLIDGGEYREQVTVLPDSVKIFKGIK